MVRRAPDPFSYHEALDRVRILARLTDMLLTEHPAILAHPRWKRRADRIANELVALGRNIANHTDGRGQ